MPITKRATKKMYHDRRRTLVTEAGLLKMKQVVKTARKTPSAKTVTLAYQALDKAAKKHLIHVNKADRLKSRLAKLLKSK